MRDIALGAPMSAEKYKSGFREASWGVESGGKPADFKSEYVWG